MDSSWNGRVSGVSQPRQIDHPLGVIITGADSKSRYANLAAQELLGRAIPAGVQVSELNAQLFLGA